MKNISAIEVLAQYDNESIVDSIIRDKFYSHVLFDIIQAAVQDFDADDKRVFSDLNNTAILFSAFRDVVSDGEIVGMMCDAGFTSDLAVMMDEKFEGMTSQPDWRE